MTWLDVLGWTGSALLVYSVMQARVLRFRVLNLAACIVLTGYNAALEIWPMVAMNIALLTINGWHVRTLLTTRHDSDEYAVLEVGRQDAYLKHLLAVHDEDIRRFQPDLGELTEGDLPFVIQRGDETVGVVVLRIDGAVAHIRLDYVTPRYRDFSPGQFVWRHSDLLAGRGLTTVLSSPAMVGAYYDRLGFTATGNGAFQLDLAP